MAEASLTVTDGKEKGRWNFIPLDRASVVLGRGDEADFSLDDERVSRVHVRITSKDYVWTAEDVGGANGTFVNGNRLRGAARLTSGDEIRVGTTTLKFEIMVRPQAPGIEKLTGRTIGGYEIHEQIGRGVGGVVYRARQKSLDREVAVKLLMPKLVLDPSFLKLFFEEARAASRLSHPNVVRVYDGGRDQGFCYFSMELMNGGSVGDLLAKLPQRKLPPESALRMTLDAARGLDYAEKSGIIHRDIKPDNLMLTDDHRVKIGDLGIAIRVGDQNVKRMGSPQFLAPEIAAGLAASAVSDIYGLGASLYRMLSGRMPYPAKTSTEALHLIREGPPQPLAIVAPVLPREVHDLVAKMMAREPAERPQAARHVIAMIEKL